MTAELIEQFEILIRRDPARRGLVGSDERYGPLCPGHLSAAARHIAQNATHVGLATGFFIPHGTPPAAETDGPLGTVLLAVALASIGIKTTILTDENCATAVDAAIDATGILHQNIYVFPQHSKSCVETFFAHEPGRSMTHLISIERAGPSHTPESLRRQRGQDHPLPEQFVAHVPADSYDRCHNMRGEIIDEHTADIHPLFEEAHRHRPDLKTIGIGDGANEIGMGSICWEELIKRLDGSQAPRIPCRIATDWNIVAGTSNWGGYALAAATLLLRNCSHHLKDWNQEQQLRVLQHMVEHGPAVDGVTGRREATVDGLPFLTYIQPWEGIRRLLGFKD